jgi:excisionase family DNA binding protein
VEAFVKIEQAADFLGVRVSWVYEQVRLGKLPSYKVGVFRRFRLSELDAWARENQNGLAQDPRGEQRRPRRPA